MVLTVRISLRTMKTIYSSFEVSILLSTTHNLNNIEIVMEIYLGVFRRDKTKIKTCLGENYVRLTRLLRGFLSENLLDSLKKKGIIKVIDRQYWVIAKFD